MFETKVIGFGYAGLGMKFEGFWETDEVPTMMWTCKQCGEENEHNFDACWNCTSTIDGEPTITSEELEEIKENIKESDYEESIDDASDENISKYTTARSIAQLISSIGWVLVFITILIVFFGIAEGMPGAFIFPMMIFSIVGVAVGLSLVISGQLTRAVVDNANTSDEILFLIKKIANKMKAL